MIVSESPLVASGRAVCLPGKVRRHGTRLLNQQFWLWGQDIRREDNLLLRYGFSRTRPPGDVQGGRCYALKIDARRVVVLWGFGIFYGDRDHGGIYLSRFRLAPLLAKSGKPPTRVWAPRDLPPLRSPDDDRDWSSARLLLDAVLRWISAYEAWVLAEMGGDYRQLCLACWPRAVCAATDGSAHWLRLAQRCDATLTRATASPLGGAIDNEPGGIVRCS